MRRVLAIVACGLAAAGCASDSDALKAVTPTMTLQFESEPAGAEVKTSSGQTCRTPCALAVPAADVTVTYALNGFKSQTVPVKLMPPDEQRLDPEIGGGGSLPRFHPNPVYAELEKAAPPPRRPAPRRPTVQRPPAADASTDEPAAAAATTARPPQQQTAPAPRPQPQQQAAPAAPAPSASSPWPPPPPPPTQIR